MEQLLSLTGESLRTSGILNISVEGFLLFAVSIVAFLELFTKNKSSSEKKMASVSSCDSEEDERKRKKNIRRPRPRSRSMSTSSEECVSSSTTEDSASKREQRGRHRHHRTRKHGIRSSRSNHRRKHKRKRRGGEEKDEDHHRSAMSYDSGCSRRKETSKSRRRTRSEDSSDNEKETRKLNKRRKSSRHRKSHGSKSKKNDSSLSSSCPRTEDIYKQTENDKGNALFPSTHCCLEKEQGLNKTSSGPNVTSTGSTAVNDETQKQEHEQKAARAAKMVPMTREQYELQQSIVREVHDPDTGRARLVRGTGEIIERIVRREEHALINRIATSSDGRSFARGVASAVNALSTTR